MVNNVFVQCNACKMKINLRAQIGFFDIPFHVRCPKCHSTIYGKVFVEDNNINVVGLDYNAFENFEIDTLTITGNSQTLYLLDKALYDTQLQILKYSNGITLDFAENAINNEYVEVVL